MNDTTERVEEDAKRQEENQKLLLISEDASPLLNALFYVYYEHQIMGPYEGKDIITLYITGKIKDECWVIGIQYNTDNDKWCKVILSSTDAANNDELKTKYPDLHAYLVPKLLSDSMKQYEPPVYCPKGALETLSIMRKLIQLVGRIVAGVAAVWIALHLLPTACIACCCWIIPGAFICDSDSQPDKDKWFAGTAIIITYLGFVIMPFIIVYAVLLNTVDDPYWDGQIQSWMIAYIAWGVCSGIFMICVLIGAFAEMKQRTVMNKTMFWIIGVDFGDVDPMTIVKENDGYVFGLAYFILFPALAAVLPAAIIGFIANFVLEEKFELKCGEQVDDTTLCYNDYGCCEVISSHDASSSYQFMGGLASNVLATWAVLRIIGYLVVNMIPESSMFAKRRT